MTDEFRKKVIAVKDAIQRVREGRIERTVLKQEGARSYTETLQSELKP